MNSNLKKVGDGVYKGDIWYYKMINYEVSK